MVARGFRATCLIRSHFLSICDDEELNNSFFTSSAFAQRAREKEGKSRCMRELYSWRCSTSKQGLGEFVGLWFMSTSTGLEQVSDRLFGDLFSGIGVDLNVIAVEEAFEIRFVSRCTSGTQRRLMERTAQC